MSIELGICLQGVEAEFEHALRERAKAKEPFVFMEIGTAHCETWLNVCRLLATTKANWRTIGIDPSPDALDAYKLRIEPEFGHDRALLLVRTREGAFAAENERIGNRLDFVFIDGCHAKLCVMGDFFSVEPLVVRGGLVVFHDTDQPAGGIQPHCNAGADVKGALEELGLWQDSRPGWKRLPDWTCDKTKNAFSCAVFQATSYRSEMGKIAQHHSFLTCGDYE